MKQLVQQKKGGKEKKVVRSNFSLLQYVAGRSVLSLQSHKRRNAQRKHKKAPLDEK